MEALMNGLIVGILFGVAGAVAGPVAFLVTQPKDHRTSKNLARASRNWGVAAAIVGAILAMLI